MPRLTNTQYLAAKKWLAQTWLDDNAVWAQTSAADQRVLHDYFEPGIPMPPDEAIAHRKDVTVQQPSLPRRTGRALKRFEQVVGREIIWMPRPSASEPVGRQVGHAISVRSVMKPHPDMDRLARVIRKFAEEQRGQDDAA